MPTTVENTRARLSSAPRSTPPLENGDNLTSSEFMRRYEAAPALKKAQLIEGIVHMPSPVRADLHAEPDGLIQFWLSYYAMTRPHLKVYPNATLLLDPDNAVQPDAILCSAPSDSGPVRIGEDGYLLGTPELVCEIAASSASVDLHAKFHAYQRNRIPEYFVWLTLENSILWFHLDEDRYVESEPSDGRLASSIFPGLILDVDALLSGDRARLVAALGPA